MIFVTVGTQLAFDRLVGTVDDWAGRSKPSPDVFAQIGPSNLALKHVAFERFINPSEFSRHAHAASVIVAHAGIGSIITALRYEKPIVIMPRHASLGEHRNDHQLATVTRFEGRSGIFVAHTETELAAMLDRLDDLKSGEPLSPFGSRSLIAAVQEFIDRAA